MVFHLERLVEWRHPSLTASTPAGAEQTHDILQVACPACGRGYLAAPDVPAAVDLADAARGHLAEECPDHPAHFLVQASGA